MKTTQLTNTRKLTVIAIMGAISTLLMFFEFSLPFVIPSFVKLDFSDFPALITAFSIGPLGGIAVCLIKNLIHLTTSSSMGVGELANFILGCSFVLPAGLLYKRNKTRKTALSGAIFGSLLMAVVSLFMNYFIIYPFYAVLYFGGLESGMSTIISMYAALLPSVKNLWQCLLIFNLPFTFVKGLISVVLTLITYKRISILIKGKSV